jgi:hypothetical protein
MPRPNTRRLMLENVKKASEGVLRKLKEGRGGWGLARGFLPGLALGAAIGGLYGAIAGSLIGFMVAQTLSLRDSETRISEALLFPERASPRGAFPESLALVGLAVWWARRDEGSGAHATGFARGLVAREAARRKVSQEETERIFEAAESRADALDGGRLAAAYGRTRDPLCAALPAELLFGMLHEGGSPLTPGTRREIMALLSKASVPEGEAEACAKAFFPDYLNPYEILGIEEGAGRDEAKRSFRRLSLMFHPDANEDLDEERRKASKEAFIAIKEAYAEVLALCREAQPRKGGRQEGEEG